MQFERSRWIGRHAIFFDIQSITLHTSERRYLSGLCLGLASAEACHAVTGLAMEIYDRMQAGERPCRMRVMVSEPLPRAQADALNARRETVISLLAGATGVAGRIHPIAAPVAVAATRKYLQSDLRSYHAGDVIVGVDAEVDGGIGPQRSARPTLIRAGVPKP